MRIFDKPLTILISITLVIIFSVFYFIFDNIVIPTKEKTIELQPTIEKPIIGKCFKLKDNNPFETVEIVIKIIDQKDGYYLSEYKNTRGRKSDRIEWLDRIYTEIKCTW